MKTVTKLVRASLSMKDAIEIIERMVDWADADVVDEGIAGKSPRWGEMVEEDGRRMVGMGRRIQLCARRARQRKKENM